MVKETRTIKLKNGSVIDVHIITKLLDRINEEFPDNKRTMQTLRKWEHYGVMPKPIFKLSNRRYYSDAEIDTIVDILREVNPRQGRHGSNDELKVLMFSKLDATRKKLIGQEDRK